MKKLLYQFDTDAHPAVFDNVVAYDGGADHITAYGAVNAGNVGGLVEGAIFTRSPKDKKNTAIFIGGSNMAEGQALLAAVQKKFFAKFRVSVMFDCNGSNTTAAAAVAWLAHGRSLGGKRAVVLGGTGPVGQRAAALLSREGATVAITGRKIEVVQTACASIKSRFGADVEAIAAPTHVERGAAIEGAQIVLATGAAGISAGRHRRRVHGRSRHHKPRQDSLRTARFRRPQARLAPRLHCAPVRAERSSARCGRDLRARQDDGRLTPYPLAWTNSRCDHPKLDR
jgi:methylenetetrahydrofolate/methylenetetrahydromethanopterin dehydrogenase (NADP+)